MALARSGLSIDLPVPVTECSLPASAATVPPPAGAGTYRLVRLSQPCYCSWRHAGGVGLTRWTLRFGTSSPCGALRLSIKAVGGACDDLELAARDFEGGTPGRWARLPHTTFAAARRQT